MTRDKGALAKDDRPGVPRDGRGVLVQGAGRGDGEGRAEEACADDAGGVGEVHGPRHRVQAQGKAVRHDGA